MRASGEDHDLTHATRVVDAPSRDRTDRRHPVTGDPMSFQAYLDAVETKTDVPLASSSTKPGSRASARRRRPARSSPGSRTDYDLGRGHGMALVHVIKKGPKIDAKHVGTSGPTATRRTSCGSTARPQPADWGTSVKPRADDLLRRTSARSVRTVTRLDEHGSTATPPESLLGVVRGLDVDDVPVIERRPRADRGRQGPRPSRSVRRRPSRPPRSLRCSTNARR